MSDLGYPLYMNGKLMQRPVTITHQPAAGFGEYFESGVEGIGEYYTEPNAAVNGLGAPLQVGPGGAFRDGSLGTYVRKPSKGADLARRISPLAGALGQVADAATANKEVSSMTNTRRGASPVVVGVAVAGTMAAIYLAVYGVAGYYAGKAMAPSKKAKGYGTAGAIASILFGSVGLGVVGAVALADKD